MSMEKYNKEQIRNRMLKYAAAFWGIKKAENFDPVVKLMLEALSNELYMLGENFTAIETRLLEKNRPHSDTGHTDLGTSRTWCRACLSHRARLPDYERVGHVL